MNKKYIRKVSLAAIPILTLLMANEPINAGTISLHYTQGAPSSECCVRQSVSYISCGCDNVAVNISTFDYERYGCYMSLSTSPRQVNKRSFNSEIRWYENFYNNGASTVTGSYCSADVQLCNYGNQRYFNIYGTIAEAYG